MSYQESLKYLKRARQAFVSYLGFEAGLKELRLELNSGVPMEASKVACHLNDLHVFLHGSECLCGLGNLDLSEYQFGLPPQQKTSDVDYSIGSIAKVMWTNL